VIELDIWCLGRSLPT